MTGRRRGWLFLSYSPIHRASSVLFVVRYRKADWDISKELRACFLIPLFPPLLQSPPMHGGGGAAHAFYFTSSFSSHRLSYWKPWTSAPVVSPSRSELAP